MIRKVAFKTLGCRLNQYETDAIASGFDKRNFQIVDFKDHADLYVINSCTVTNQSDTRSKSFLRQAQQTNPKALTLFTGCMAEAMKRSDQTNEKADLIIENKYKSSIIDIIEAYNKGEFMLPEEKKFGTFAYEAAEKTFHTRAMVKIQDGCDNFCTFCIIPQVRGRAISRPWKDIEQNIQQLLDFGYKEFVLTGVNIGRYAFNGMNFEQIVARILEMPGDFRLRISSIEPDGFTDQFFELFSHPKLTPHLHLCLQSGSERMLLQMRRMYTAKQFRLMAEKLRAQYPDFNLTTDIIVGFPGEDESDFQASVDIAKELEFSHIHTFKYSVRKQTRAARMTGQVPEKVKTERSAVIRQISKRNKWNYRKRFVGKKATMLTEKPDDAGRLKGYGAHYQPIRLSSGTIRSNEFVQVKMTELVRNEEPYLLAEPVKE